MKTLPRSTNTSPAVLNFSTSRVTAAVTVTTVAEAVTRTVPRRSFYFCYLSGGFYPNGNNKHKITPPNKGHPNKRKSRPAEDGSLLLL